MRRVLVPLDGSVLSEAILPDARRLAGLNGELSLIRNVRVTPDYAPDAVQSMEASSRYLESVAEGLRANNIAIRTQTFAMATAAFAIDEAARIFEADMIATATHGHGLAYQLVRESVAWQALVHSPVPVLLRHVEKPRDAMSAHEPQQRRILVPLDASRLAEKALPLAAQLAAEWRAPILLVEVVPETVVSSFDASGLPYYYDNTVIVKAASDYLDRISEGLHAQVEVSVVIGSTVDTLVEIVNERSITDIVMASHGRTGLTRVILGSVADALIHRLHCPIIVIPALAAPAPAGGGTHGGQAGTSPSSDAASDRPNRS